MTTTARPRPVNVVWFDEVDSTAALADRLMAVWIEKEEDPLPETLVVARAQSEGRGRGANRWSSPPGGLYANWLAWVPAAELGLVPMAVGVALADAVEALLPTAAVGFKWPNDLIAGGGKLGGILCHSRGSGESAWVSVGFGINLAGETGAEGAASLRALGWTGDPGAGARAVVDAFLANVRAALADEPGTRGRWLARSVHRKGDAIRLRLEGGVVEGRFVGFDAEGRLEIETGGETRRFSVGEVMLGDASGGG